VSFRGADIDVPAVSLAFDIMAPRHAANERGRALAQAALGISSLCLAAAVLFLAVLADEYLFR
jgi:hypothetical protein